MLHARRLPSRIAVLGSVLAIASLVGCSSRGDEVDPAAAPDGDEAIGTVSQGVCGTSTVSWSAFPAGNGSQQCVTGVRQFYQNKFGTFVPPASGGPVGVCARFGACNIWVNPANRPSAAVWNRYAWGTKTPQAYDMVVFTASSAHPYGHIASVDHYSAGRLWVMDSNYSPWAGRKAACVHDTAGHTPYGFYRLKSLEPATTPPPPPPKPTACHSTAGGFSFSCDGAVKDSTCVQITETAVPAWKDDYFCGEQDYGLEWSEKGPIAGMKCTNITQTDAAAATATAWKDNFLCVPPDSQLTLTWSSKGPIAGQSCTCWNESTDTSTTSLDNYLCVDIADAVTPPETGDPTPATTPTTGDPAPTAADAPAAEGGDDSSGCSVQHGTQRTGGAGLCFGIVGFAALALLRRRRSR